MISLVELINAQRKEKLLIRSCFFAGLSIAERQLCVNNQADTDFNLVLAYPIKHVYD